LLYVAGAVVLRPRSQRQRRRDVAKVDVLCVCVLLQVVCALYPDPVSGFPPRYARDSIPKITSYPDGQTTPTPSAIDFTPGALLGSVSGELGLRKFLESHGHTFVVTSDKDGDGCELERELADADVVISQPFYPFYLTKVMPRNFFWHVALTLFPRGGGLASRTRCASRIRMFCYACVCGACAAPWCARPSFAARYARLVVIAVAGGRRATRVHALVELRGARRFCSVALRCTRWRGCGCRSASPRRRSSSSL
jgi:hypothetical protein